MTDIATGGPGGAAETHHTFCRICESLCGLEVTVEQGAITKIRPDDDHVATGGFACIKGIRQHEMYTSPDRLTHPMERTGDTWQQVGWDHANAEIGRRVRAIIDEHGPDSVAMYVGTAAGFGVLHPVFAQGFMDGLGSTRCTPAPPRTAPTSSPPPARCTATRSPSPSPTSTAPNA